VCALIGHTLEPSPGYQPGVVREGSPAPAEEPDILWHPLWRHLTAGMSID